MEVQNLLLGTERSGCVHSLWEHWVLMAVLSQLLFHTAFCDLKDVTWNISSIKSTVKLDVTISYRNPGAASNLNSTEHIFIPCSLSAIKEIAVDILIAAIWQKKHTPVDSLAQNNLKGELQKQDMILLKLAPPCTGYRKECPVPRPHRTRPQCAQVHVTTLPDGRAVVTSSDGTRAADPAGTCQKWSYWDKSSRFE